MPLLLFKSCLTPVKNSNNGALAVAATPREDVAEKPSSSPKKALFGFIRSSSCISSTSSNESSNDSNNDGKHTTRLGLLGDSSRRIGLLGDSSRRLGNSSRIVNAEELLLLEALREVITKPDSLHRLISKTLTIQGDLGTRIRFVAAVGEYQRTTPPAEKLAKARKIVSMFIQNGSMFQLECVPRELQRRTSWKHYRDLELVRDQVELSLVRDEVIREAMKGLFPELC